MRMHRLQPGFTFVELCLGLVVTTLVMGAVAAFSLATSGAWKSAEKTQSLTLHGYQASWRISKQVRSARLIGASRAGSSEGVGAGAAVIIWKTDTNGDGYIQGDECEMIAHDPVNHRLILYPSGYADGVGTWSYSGTFTASSVLTQFPTNRPSMTLANGVYGAVFETSGTSGTAVNPSLKFALKLMVDDAASGGGASSAVGGGARLMVENGAATVRAPLAQPAN